MMTPGGPLVRSDLNQQAYAAIRARLLSRELGGGQRLSLQGLADELGVSRSPIYHALTRLTTEGLVVLEPSGYAVRPLTVDLMYEFHDARLALELYSARKTVGVVSTEELAKFRDLLQETLDAVLDGRLPDVVRYVQANNAFHSYQVDLCKNPTISEMYRRLSVFHLQERAMVDLEWAAAGDSSAEHRAIADCYERGDLDGVCSALAANVETGKRLSRDAIVKAGGVL
jgi:DNA-binding GntR family transcriptional regulator